VLLTVALLVGCSNSKNISEEESPEKPIANLQLAPNHIQAILKISNIEKQESQELVTAEVVEILNYGSATDPVPSGSTIQFFVSDNYSQQLRDKIEKDSKINAILFKENARMRMEESMPSNAWKLISIQ
jgi:translation elongation factor EF-Tu-like GTPase